MQETNYTKAVNLPHTRLRFYLATSSGDVEKFTIQIEYNLGFASSYPDAWRPVARFDHNPYSKKGHDVESEGLHMDVLDADNTKHDVKRGFPPVPLDETPEYCEEYLLNREEELVGGFERRNGINGLYYTP